MPDPPSAPAPALTAAEHAVHRPDSSIFRRGGAKPEAGPGAVVEDVPVASGEAVAARLAAMRAAWAAPRSTRAPTLAAWRPAGRAAAVPAPRTKLAPRIGFHHGGVLHVHPEEAAYLVDRGDGALLVGGHGGGVDATRPAAADAGAAPPSSTRPLSLQEAWTLAAAAGAPLAARAPYHHLMRAGYIVRRHPPVWYLDPGAPLGAAWGGAGWTRDGRPPALAAPPGGGSRREKGAKGTGDADGDPPTAKRPRVAPERPAPPPRAAPARGWWPAAGAGHPWSLVGPDGARVAVGGRGAGGASQAAARAPALADAAAPPDPLAPAHALAVHRCCATFSRRRPAPPLCVVAPALAAPPSRAALAAADAAAAGAPTRWAVANGGGANYFSFERVRLCDADW